MHFTGAAVYIWIVALQSTAFALTQEVEGSSLVELCCPSSREAPGTPRSQLVQATDLSLTSDGTGLAARLDLVVGLPDTIAISTHGTMFGPGDDAITACWGQGEARHEYQQESKTFLCSYAVPFQRGANQPTKLCRAELQCTPIGEQFRDGAQSAACIGRVALVCMIYPPLLT